MPKFIEHDYELQFDNEGHHSPFYLKGEDGHLLVKVKV